MTATIILMLGFIASLFVMAWIIIEIGKAQTKKAIQEANDEAKFNELYSKLQGDLKEYYGDRKLQRYFNTQLFRLENMKHKRPEMVKELRSEIDKSYINL